MASAVSDEEIAREVRTLRWVLRFVCAARVSVCMMRSRARDEEVGVM